MTDTDQPILIATDRVDDAETIARVLSEEFATVHVSTDSARSVQDFEQYRPAVLILAFNALDKAERYFQELRVPSVMARALPHRVLILCKQDDMVAVYDLCKKDHFDDFVLFWPATEETRPLRMAVHRALRQVTAVRGSAPCVNDFAAQARRLAALEPLLEGRVAQAGGNGAPADGLVSLLDPVRALRVLAERCQPLVLVVDDDAFQHKLLGQLLGPAKVELAYVTTVGEAFASLHKRRPDLILMDVGLPDIDGVEATRLLKSAAHFAAIPVIMITGVGAMNVVVDSLKAGVADFVVKPFDQHTLLGKVCKLLYGRTAAF